MSEVALNNMLGNVEHEMGVLLVPLVEYLSYSTNIIPMRLDSNVCSMVGLVVSLLVACSVQALVDLLLASVAFDLRDPN